MQAPGTKTKGFCLINNHERGIIVPNIKSAEKRRKQDITRRSRNKIIKSTLMTTVRNFNNAVKSGDKDAAVQKFDVMEKKIDSAVSKGVLHSNTAARKKSRMHKMLAKM